MANWEKHSKLWCEHGLITPEQLRAIAEFEQKNHRRHWVLLGFLILGALTVGLGIISLVAANWEHIPDPVKLAANGLLLAAVAGCIYFSVHNGKQRLRETLIALLSVQVLASIGLVGQIYHATGMLKDALVLWNIFTLGVISLSSLTLMPFLWAGVFLYSSIDVLMPFILNGSPIYLLLICPVIALILATLLSRLPTRPQFSHSFFVWSFLGNLAAIIFNELELNNAIKDGSASVPFSSITTIMTLGILTVLANKKNSIPQKLLLLIGIATLFLPTFFSLFGFSDRILWAVISLTNLTALALYFASKNFKFAFNVLLFLTGIRLIILYFQAFGGLAVTGAGLVISGCFTMACAYLGNKYHKQIALFAQNYFSLRD